MTEVLMPADCDIFIQWKGTDVCLDFHCYKCNTFAHFDGDFAYYLVCPICGQHYAMPSVVALKAVDKPDSFCIQAPTDPQRDLAEHGWATPLATGTCTYVGDKL